MCSIVLCDVIILVGMKEILKKPVILFCIFILFDVLMIILHLLLQGKTFFNLDMESNLPTIYQGVKVVLISSFSFIIITLIYLEKRNLKESIFWMFWALIFLVMAMDEVGQVHENISTYMKEIFGSSAINYESIAMDAGYSSHPWLLYYAIAFVVLTLVIAFVLGTVIRKGRILLLLGWFVLLLAPVLEYINTLPNIMFQQDYWTLMVIEESLEMLGATILLTFTFKSLVSMPVIRNTLI